MKIIALTGGIGSGKSTVAKIFSTMGVVVFDADSAAKQLYQNNQLVRQGLKSLFGANIFDTDKQLDKKRLASIVFNDPVQLAQLNALVHPAVITNFKQWLQKQSGAKLVVHETALLFESGLDKLSDRIILVTAPEELRIERVCRYRGWNRQQVLERIRQQRPEKVFQAKADHLIFNDERNALIPQVTELIRELSNTN